MGVWGAALYSGDFAMDLRATVSAVSRLPFESDRLVEILCETEPQAANESGDEDHTTFWLVLADQFARRGLVSGRVRQKALAIIDTAQDTAMLERLGMTPSDIRKRRRMLDDLRAKIAAAPARTRRPVLKKPQALLMNVGDVFVFPTCGGKCINPYYPSKELDKRYTKSGPVPWQQDGWGAAIVVDCGRAFDFLAWYRPLTVSHASPEKPSIASVRGDVRWRLVSPGTCSPAHFRKMEIETIGHLPLDPEHVQRTFPGLRPGLRAAVSDISIANRLSVIPATGSPSLIALREAVGGRTGAIVGIEQLLRA